VVAWIALAAGLVAVVGAVLVALTSFTAMFDALTFRGALGIFALIANIPVALIGIVLGLVGATSPKRTVALVGLGLSVLSLAGLIVMIAAVE